LDDEPVVSPCPPFDLETWIDKHLIMCEYVEGRDFFGTDWACEIEQKGNITNTVLSSVLRLLRWINDEMVQFSM